jgi:RNA polymerase sigma-70 factor (ECF subfamily)
MRNLSEAQLIQDCLSGDETAWREMVRRFQGVVYGVSYRVLKDSDEARVATQETLIKAMRSLDSFERGRRLKPWLAKIAWNHAVRIAARQRKNLVAIADDGIDGPWSNLPDPAQVTEQKEVGRALRHAMDRLPSAMQMVLEMRLGQGMDYREIAISTGWPIGTVKTNLFRARKRLIEILAESDGATS